MKRFIFKRLDRTKLVAERRSVNRAGQTFQQLKWIRPAFSIPHVFNHNVSLNEVAKPQSVPNSVQKTHWIQPDLQKPRHLVKYDSTYDMGGPANNPVYHQANTTVFGDGSTAVHEYLTSAISQALNIPTNKVTFGRDNDNKLTSVHEEIPNVVTLNQHLGEQNGQVLQRAKQLFPRYQDIENTYFLDRTPSQQAYYYDVGQHIVSEQDRQRHEVTLNSPSYVKGAMLYAFMGVQDKHQENTLINPDTKQAYMIDAGRSTMSHPRGNDLGEVTGDMRSLLRKVQVTGSKSGLHAIKTTMFQLAHIPDGFFDQLRSNLPHDAQYNDVGPDELIKRLKERRDATRGLYRELFGKKIR